jgi:hypothetical protein
MNAPLAFGFQVLSCIGIAGLLALEWTALRTLMRETLILDHLFRPHKEPPEGEESALGSRVRPFRVVRLDTGESFTEKDLIGSVTTLLFVSPKELVSDTESMFTQLLHSVWAKRRGPIYVVCSRSRVDCQRVGDRFRFGKSRGSGIDLLFDTDGSMRDMFMVMSPVRAVVIDKNGHVTKVGGIEADPTPESHSGAGA